MQSNEATDTRKSKAAELKERREALMEKWGHLKKNPAALKEVAGEIGVTPPTLWRWESANAVPHQVLLEAWAGVIAKLEAKPVTSR